MRNRDFFAAKEIFQFLFSFRDFVDSLHLLRASSSHSAVEPGKE